MKYNKRKKEDPTEALAGMAPPPQRRAMTAEQAVDKEFDYFCQSVYPDAWSEPEDQAILRATWHAAIRQMAGQLIEGVLKPMQITCNAKFQALRTPLIDAPPSGVPTTTT